MHAPPLPQSIGISPNLDVKWRELQNAPHSELQMWTCQPYKCHKQASLTMSAVSSCFPTTLLHALAQERHFLPHRLGQLREGRMPSIQQLQQIATAPAGPRRQLKRFQFLASVCSPQPQLTAQAFVQGYGLQLISSPGCASAPGGVAATAVAAGHGCPSSVSRSAENDFPAARPGYGGRPGERSRSNQRACPLASIPTRTCVACLARSRSNVSASWRWRNGCSRNSPVSVSPQAICCNSG